MSNLSSSQAFASDPAEIERDAYNAAFYALGLRWYWDSDTYNELQRIPVARDRVGMYLRTQQTHLLTAYDSDFLVDAIEAKKAQCRKSANCAGTGVTPRFDWEQARAAEVGA